MTSEAQARAATEQYVHAARRLHEAEDVDGAISVKLTQLGLDLSEDLCLRNASRVVEVATWVVDAGVEAVSLGDTVGVATPARVWATVQELRDALPELLLNLHFHDTRGAGMANVLAALELGCDEFDGSVGGIGGSPFAPGAAGNVATEELVDMLGDMGIETGVHSVEGLVEIAQYLESLLGRPLPSRVMRAGSRPRPGAAQG